MKRLYIFAAVALAGTIVLVEYDLSRRMQWRLNRNSMAAKAGNKVEVPLSEMKDKMAASINTPSSQDSFFDSAILKSAQKLSLAQIDPRTLDQKMNGLAKKLTPLEIQKLAIVARNRSESEDRRAMAVELLSRSKTPEAVLMLKEFVASRQNSMTTTNRKRELESILRAQAIEGIAGYPQKKLALSYLNSLSSQVEETFLKDRIARSEEGLRGRTVNTQQKKDESALKQLVQ